MTKSSVFRSYNVMRAAARRGFIDEGRLNRALGIVLSKSELNHIVRYHTTPESCECPDFRYRVRRKGGNCKGQLALALKELAA